MYAKGVTCNNWHKPHTALPRDTGNGLCMQYYLQTGNHGFPTLLLKPYHIHRITCMNRAVKARNARTAMVVDRPSDHSLRIPRREVSVETRGPETCTDCHRTQTASWGVIAVERRIPKAPTVDRYLLPDPGTCLAVRTSWPPSATMRRLQA